MQRRFFAARPTKQTIPGQSVQLAVTLRKDAPPVVEPVPEPVPELEMRVAWLHDARVKCTAIFEHPELDYPAIPYMEEYMSVDLPPDDGESPYPYGPYWDDEDDIWPNYIRRKGYVRTFLMFPTIRPMPSEVAIPVDVGYGKGDLVGMYVTAPEGVVADGWVGVVYGGARDERDVIWEWEIIDNHAPLPTTSNGINTYWGGYKVEQDGANLRVAVMPAGEWSNDLVAADWFSELKAVAKTPAGKEIGTLRMRVVMNSFIARSFAESHRPSATDWDFTRSIPCDFSGTP